MTDPSDQEARKRDAEFCLAPLRDLAGKREYDEALRRIVEMLLPHVDMAPVAKLPAVEVAAVTDAGSGP
jgi:hypothetical protein